MTTKNETSVNTEGELEITRVFDAPRSLVWRAWTEAELLKQWFGPEGFTIPHCTIDLRVGGKFLLCMRSPEGRDMWLTGTYREIGPVERLVKTESMADAEGNVVDIGMPGMPLETLVTLKLEEEGKSRTRMTLWHAGLPEGDHRSHAGEGYRQAFEKFAAVLEKEREKTGKGNPS